MCSQDITLDICLYYVMNKPLFMSRAIFKPDVPIHLTLKVEIKQRGLVCLQLIYHVQEKSIIECNI
jgi:hypothetical protein